MNGFGSAGALMKGFNGGGDASGAAAGAANGEVIPAKGEFIKPGVTGGAACTEGVVWAAIAEKGLFPSGAFACKTVKGEAPAGVGEGRPDIF